MYWQCTYIASEVSDFGLIPILRLSMTVRAGLPYQFFELNGRYRQEHRAPSGHFGTFEWTKSGHQSGQLRSALNCVDADPNWETFSVHRSGAPFGTVRFPKRQGYALAMGADCERYKGTREQNTNAQERRSTQYVHS